ncbi:glycoside hydrolase family 38 C-terminal domain-containing protein [Pontibacillus yanchengensis]
MMTSKKVYVVPHSHWDREWYFTIEDSNLLLAENMDYLLDVLETNPNYHSYVFDAQMSVIEEYLHVRPENRERLQTLIQNKRILVGPWYTQTDSLLVNTESIIRNLLYGTRMATSMGHSMNIGYLPDIFGQNAYLPSLFKGFGMEYSILQRGVYSDQLDQDLNFYWASPDGASIKTNLMMLGYGPGKFLTSEQQFFEEKLQPILDKLANMNQSTNNLLLPSGGDQVLVRNHFPDTIEALNEKDHQHEYVLSDYETFMEETWHEGHSFDTTISGELIGTERSRIHNTIRSQRYDIKQLNTIVENKILHQLEPLATIGMELGLRFPQERLDEMWKELFDVHAHDSIGGCNSDDTNHDVLMRLRKVDRMADGLLNLQKKQMTHAIANKLNQDNIFVLFNTKPTPYTGQIKTTLFTDEPTFQLTTMDGSLLDSTITKQDYLSGGKKVVVTAEGDKEVELPGYYRSELLIHVTELNPMGYNTFFVNQNEGSVDILEETKDGSISNQTLRVDFHSNGTLSLTNKQSGQKINDMIQFENVADAGDSYDFSPLPEDHPIYIKDAELITTYKTSGVETMDVVHNTHVPRDLSERSEQVKTKTLTIHTTFELRASEGFVRVHHEIQNEVKDHRVRVLLRTPVTEPQESFADQGFGTVTRSTINPYLSNWKERGFKEAPVSIYPLEQFVGVENKATTFAAITSGLKEYEVLPHQDHLALTLFRSVGLLGKDNLAWRPGRASGINNKVVYTPDAQMQKHMTFDYAICFESKQIEKETLFEKTQQYNNHYVTYQKQSLNTFEERLDRFEIPYPISELPSSFSLFQIDHPHVFMSVCKKSYEDDKPVVRLFNPSNEMQQASVETDVYHITIHSNLYEADLEPIQQVSVPSKGYETIKLGRKGETR